MDNNKWGWKQGKEVGRAGGVGKAGRIRQKTVLEQLKDVYFFKKDAMVTGEFVLLRSYSTKVITER